MISIPSLLSVARGDSPADLLLRNARIVNVFSGEIEHADIAIADDRIAAVGQLTDAIAKETIDLAGAFVAPGLIDAHVHIESSLCTPPNFAAAVVPRGVTTVIADPHEIANVAGVDGVRFMVESSRGLPLSVIMMAPSCVPATNLATAGAVLTAADLAMLRDEGLVHGLAEVMNFPGVVNADAEMMAKLDAFRGRPIDGHAPSLSGRSLCAYIASGVGSDHECISVDEAREKLARGLYILIREATNAHNLDTLLPLITPANSRRICLCTDDRQPDDLLSQGSIDFMLRRIIAAGVNPITAFRLCTLNPSEWFGLHDRGAIAPGRRADFFIFDDLTVPAARQVYVGGRIPRFETATHAVPTRLRESVRFDLRQVGDWNIRPKSDRMRVIGLRPDQLITDELIVSPTLSRGFAVADPSRDILKIAVCERHGTSSRYAFGFIKGFGLQRGAIAGSVAHDHHNIVAVGCSDAAMFSAINAVTKSGGGLAAIDRMDELKAFLPLPVAGLMSDRPIEEVRENYLQLLAAAKELGSTLHDPFMAMSFMALEVIPKLKLTDQGLIDVETFSKTSLFV